MITFFRRMFTSKIGGIFALLFLGLIAVAFAGGDIANVGGFGGVSGGNVAKVGDRQIGIAELEARIRDAHAQAQQQNPTLTLSDFMAQGGADDVLNGMIDGYALEQYAKKLGFTVSKTQVDAEIIKLPQFKGLTGEFDQNQFQLWIAQSKTTEKQLREDIGRGLLVEQLLRPVGRLASVPAAYAKPYAELALEQRVGQATFIPSSAYAPTADPSETQLASFLKDNAKTYRIAEQRSIRYAEFNVKDLAKPKELTEAEIADFYKANADQFAARETRKFSQIIAPDKAAAEKLATAAKSGSLDTAAQAAGLAAASVESANETQLAGSTSAAIAKAAFAAKQGDIIGPLQGSLGWVVLKVDSITGTPARSLEQARAEISKVVGDRKTQEAALDAFNAISDSVNKGASVTEIAGNNGLTLTTSPLLTAAATSLEQPGFKVSDVLGKIIPSAFELSGENLAEIVEIIPNERYAIAEVAKLVASAPPPLADIRNRLSADWKQAEGAKKARDLAKAITDSANKSGDIVVATRASGAQNAGVQSIKGVRKDVLTAQAQGGVPRELAMLFTMDAKTAKSIELPGNSGWMVVFLNEINRANIAPGDTIVAAQQNAMIGTMGNELVGQLLKHARKTVGSEVDAGALSKIKAQLSGNAAPAL